MADSIFETVYQCPRCLKAAFYLPGKPWEYKVGQKADFPKTLSCQGCNFPFTTGQLYLKNLRELATWN